MKRVDVPTDFFSNCSKGDKVRLPDDTAHYVGNVLRREPGDRLEFFDGTGNLASVEILRVADEITVEIVEFTQAPRRESPIETILFQAIPKGKRWDWILEKATELGVDAIVPLESEHTVVQIPADRLRRRRDRWDKKLSSAARQCQRTVIPSIVDPAPIADAMADHDCDIHLVAHPGEDAPTVGEALDRAEADIDSVGIWIGPEGGFSDDEVSELEDQGMARITLGPRILRADTAGIAALTLVQASCGDLRTTNEQRE